MTPSIMTLKEFHDAAASFLDGVIDATTHERFEQALRRDRSYRDLYRELAQTHAELAWVTRWQAAVTEQVPGERHVMKRVRLIKPWATLAAMVALAAGLWFANPFARHTESLTRPDVTTHQSVATVTDLEHAVFADLSPPARLGGMLPAGPIQLTSGRAQVMFNSTAVVDLTGPCNFQMTSPNRGRLVAGRLGAYVPDLAHGFVIDLPEGARIIDLGTRFTAIAADDGASILRVGEGSVRLETRDHQFKLSAGDVRQIRDGVARDISDDVLTMNPVAYWRFDVTEDHDAVDLVGLRRAVLKGTAQLTDSAGGPCLDLDGKGYMIVASDDELDHVGNRLTVATWVRLNSRNRQAIVHKCYENTSYSMEIYDEQPAFVVTLRNLHKPIHVGAGMPMPIDRWVLLVGVYDGRAVSLYVDGTRVATEATPHRNIPVNISHGPMFIGRRSDRPEDFVAGQIGRVAIFHSALSSDQIASLNQLVPTPPLVVPKVRNAGQ